MAHSRLFIASTFISCSYLLLVSVSLADAAAASSSTATTARGGLDREHHHDSASSQRDDEPVTIQINNKHDNIAAESPPKKKDESDESPNPPLPKSKRRRRRTEVAPLNVFLLVKDQFDRRRGSIEELVFQSFNAFSTTSSLDDISNNSNANKKTSPSRMYTYTAFFESLRTIAVDGILGNSYNLFTNPFNTNNAGDNSYVEDESNMAFYMSQDNPSNVNAVKYAIVNICAFLASAMAEAIQFDACEEFNGMVSGTFGSAGSRGGNVSGKGLLSELGGVNGRYFPMSNACGQFGQLYQQEECSSAENDDDDMSCPFDPNMEVTAELHPKYNYDPSKDKDGIRHRPPPPFTCVPKDFPEDYSGYWDGYDLEFVRRVAYPSALGEISVEGCCWWGRGALMTRGTCGLGRVNHFLGKRAYDNGRPSRYPNVDFCKSPSVICGDTNLQYSGVAYPELKFVVALFDWVDRVQSYSNANSEWEYLPQLKQFVDGGMEEDSQFIDDVSSILTRGCDGYYCSERTIHFLEERRTNFEALIYDVFNLKGRPDALPRPITQPRYDFEHAMGWLHSKRSKIEGNVFVSENNALDGIPYFSQAYKFEPFLSALRTASHYGFGNQRYFFISDKNKGLRGFNAGLVNLAFFLANAMTESIINDSCDEVHWEKNDGKYAIANSCGQNGREYSGEVCPRWESFITCNVDIKAEMQADVPGTAIPPFLIDMQPLPPFQCRAGTNPVGYWDAATDTLHENEALNNTNGRTDVEGCCFWGRGALLTRGTCNYGKLNFYIGAQAAAQGRSSMYPDIDFCTNPGAICDDDSMETRYVVGMFEWIDRVQGYYDSNLDWSYLDELYKFVDNGMDGDVFIDSVSSIIVRGCHLSHNYPCSKSTSHLSLDTDRLLYGLERRMNFKNIIKLVFAMPIVAPTDDRAPGNDNGSVTSQIQTTRRPTFRPTFKPTPYPFMNVGDPTMSPLVSPGISLSKPGDPPEPTSSPVEWSDITIYRDGKIHVINNGATSFRDESIVVTKNTTLELDQGGFIEAPLNTDWPAIRISISSRFIGRGGHVNGSYANTSFLEGDYENGGEAIHVNNGQSSPETASYAEFYDGIRVMGGDAPAGVGGNALHVNGFGTTVVIQGGTFRGGKGSNDDDGLSIHVLNSANVHVRGGTFLGDMKVERYGQVRFYGCFRKDGTKVTGVFADDSELDITVRAYLGGEVVLIPISEQECETAPSVSPTNFPTLSSQPSVPQPNYGYKTRVSYGLILVASVLVSMHEMWG